MYWIPKLNKNPVGSRFIITSKNCSTKPLSKAVSNVFKLIYFQIENFHPKSKFLSNYKKFWVLQNVDPVIENINIINRKKKAISVATYDFSTFYTTFPHDKLIKNLSNVIDFVFESGNRTHICISKKNVACWGKKSKDNIGFSKSTLTTFLKHLIQNCHFMDGNSLFRQKIGIPMEIDPAPFWANLFLYTYEYEYLSEFISNDKVKASHSHATKRFIDDLDTLNDGCVFNDVYKDIYPPELQLKVEHSGTHATFLNLDIMVKDGVFIYKLFDKRDAFPFFIVCMTYVDRNIPKTIFYSALAGEFLRIARSSLYTKTFMKKLWKCLIE